MIDIPIRARDALKEGSYRKNWRFKILNADGSTDFVIDNENLVSESVNYDERMCSSSKLKFGLCEGTNLEFQYFDKPNITGRHLQAVIDVEYEDADKELKWHEIPMGFFDVDECSRQASTGIIKVSCYNKLLSDYLDEKINSKIKEMSGMSKIPVVDVLRVMLDDYSIKEKPKEKFPLITAEASQSVGVANVGNYTYTTLYGDLGAFTPWTFDKDLTTSTNMYLACQVMALRFPVPADKKYIRIELTKDFTSVENQIYNGFANMINQAHLSISGAQAKDMLAKSTIRTETSPASNISGSPFSIKIFHRNGTAEVFSTQGKRCGTAVGSFEDLTKKTFMDVSYVVLTQPVFIYHSYKVTNDEIGSNYPCYTRDQWDNRYFYMPDSRTTLTNSFPSPTMANGDSIPLIETWHGETFWGMGDFINAYAVEGLDEISLTEIDVTNMEDVTLRDLQSAVFEQTAQYGKLDRVTDLFAGVTLNNSRLYPAETLYPANGLYPASESESAFKAMYSKLWADEGNIRKFRYLIITYKGTDGNDHTLQRTVDEHGTDNYNMSDNWLFRNVVWNATDVGKYADDMVKKLRNVVWFPFEMWSAGLPYIEAGDEIEIPMGDTTYTTYVLERTLKGIQNLQDEYMNGTLNIF